MHIADIMHDDVCVCVCVRVFTISIESVQLPYKPSCPPVYRLICQNFLKGGKIIIPSLLSEHFIYDYIFVHVFKQHRGVECVQVHSHKLEPVKEGQEGRGEGEEGEKEESKEGLGGGGRGPEKFESCLRKRERSA